ncbi:unnamed protein product [Didymodactylos carnosus]|uniref:G-protein coupled receptors family 1 profile domain-containing protein n=1 Tax=Didymodactylos carnosus TaxID=1234261 RepID=A0A813UK59_9BILA|nr:unnamed protein product [Didymodactylos carnosus]CAF0828818.1 unnamed protein product [Didymodactylos carnosus]CAF3565449.1 unnamed protein product [Didymodactylos carnosus]CAF3615811.1 unnamed protein product [Didymodactylos carnosus]
MLELTYFNDSTWFNISPFEDNSQYNGLLIEFVTKGLYLNSSSLLVSSTNCGSYPCLLKYLIAVIGALSSLLTIGGNMLVVVAFFLDRQIRHPTNYFIFSLAVSDFLIGISSIPMFTLYIYKERWLLGSFLCDIWLSVDYTVCLASIYTVLLITIDRFCSVKLPAKYRNWRTKNRIIMMILITWIIPTLIFFISTIGYPYMVKNSVGNYYNSQCDVQWNKDPFFNLSLTIGYFWITLLVMFVLYFFIYQVASNLERRSNAKAKKVSNLIGLSSSAMTNLVMTMSKPRDALSDNQEIVINKPPLLVPSSKTVSNKLLDSRDQKKTTNETVQKTVITTKISAKERFSENSLDDDIEDAHVYQNAGTSNGSNQNQNNHEDDYTQAINHSSSHDTSDENTPNKSVLKTNDESKNLLMSITPTVIGSQSPKTIINNQQQKAARTSNKARKALRTITFIMGAFVLCWTPVSITL